MHQLQGNKEYGSEKKGYLLKKSDGYVHSQPGVPCVLSILPGVYYLIVLVDQELRNILVVLSAS